jgi:hypothetical protein
MRWRGLAGLAAAALAVATACSLVVDTDGLSGGGPDASAEDAPVPGDASADATPAPDAGRCDADFCDDFDEGVLGARWSRVVAQRGTIAFDTTSFRSAPRSFRATTQADAGEATAYLAYDLPSVPKAIECSFSLRVNAPDGGTVGYADVFQFAAVGPGIGEYQLRLGFFQGQPSVREDVYFDDAACGCPRKDVDLPPIAPGAWLRVTMATDFTTLTVTYADAQVYKGPFTGFTPTAVSVILGLEDFSRRSADVQYDDLACRFAR